MLVYSVNEENCKNFLKRQPLVKQSMMEYGNYIGSFNKRYVKWLRWKNENEDKIATNSRTIKSPSFGTKTFYDVEWCGVSGWAELFQYLNINCRK